MTSPYEPPRSSIASERLTLDQVTLRRADPPAQITQGAIAEAWEWVKKRPAETIGLSLLSMIFSGNCNGGNFGDLTGGGGGYDGPDTYDGYDGYDGFFGSEGIGGVDLPSAVDSSWFDFLFSGWWPGFARIFGRLAAGFSRADEFDDIFGQLDAAAVVGIVVVVLIVGVIFWVIGTFIRGGANIFWLRLIRGQEAKFGHVTSAWPFLAPLLISGLLTGLATAFGLMLLIVPGIIIALGLWFTALVIVDKNLGAMDGLTASWRMLDGYKGELFIFAIVIGLLNVLGVILCCVGVVVTNAVAMGAMVIVYDRLAEPGNAYLDQAERVPPESTAGAPVA